MTPTETVMLCRLVKALCPQQAIDSYTPDAWYEVLGHLDLAECKQAVVTAARRTAFIAPAEIIAEIAESRSSELPHSEACRAGGCRDCRFGAGQQAWCMCVCHPRAVKALAAPEPARPALPSGTRRFDPGALRIGRYLEPEAD